MTDIFTFPSAINDRAAITAQLTPRPAWDEPQVAATLASFGMSDGRRKDRGGPRLVITDDRAELEIFRTSDSVRWSAADTANEEPAEPPTLPAQQQAIEQAAAMLEQRGVAQPEGSVASVTESVHSRIGPGNEVLARYPVAIHVNHGFRLGGLRVFGPGAKLQVTLGDRSSLVQLYTFWRHPRPGPTFDTIGYQRAADLIRTHSSFATMVAGGRAQVGFDQVELGYYAFPAREVQGMLIPSYRFDGRVTIPGVPEPHLFTRYVTAVDFRPADVKSSRMSPRGSLPGVFSA
jgi:hypothetical protein